MDINGGRRSAYRRPQLKVIARDAQMRPSVKPQSTQTPVFVPRHTVALPVPTATAQPQKVSAAIKDVQFVAKKSAVNQPHTPEHHSRAEVKAEISAAAGVKTHVPAPAAVAPVVNETPTKRSLRRQHRKVRRHEKAQKKADVKTDTTRKKRRVWPLYIVAAIILVVGGWLAYSAYFLNKEVEVQVKKLQAVSSTAASDGQSSGTSSLPSDTKPADKNYMQNYKVAATLPRILTIKKINVTARVMQVGVDKEGRMDVPTTAYDVAWYNGSSRPGEMGAMVIDGHVQGVGGGAIFTNLKKLVAGDQLTIEKGDGAVLTYAVTAVETIPVDQVNVGKLLVSTDTNKPGLSLITCAGSYNTESDSFDSRTIVYALQQ